MSRYKGINNSIKSHQSTASLPKEEVNVVLLGKQNVGKSALVVKYLTKRFICEYDPFLGLLIKTKQNQFFFSYSSTL
jgi:GTPase SAR1 family protein